VKAGHSMVGAEYGMETDKQDRTRQDVVTLTVGRFALQSDHSQVMVGAGARQYRPIGGQRIQNTFHRWIGNKTLDLRYDATVATPVLYGEARYWGTVIPGAWSCGHWEQASVTGVSRRLELDGSAGLSLHPDKEIQIWIGIGYCQTVGSYYGPTDREVQSQYHQFSCRAGIVANHATFSLELGPNAGFGSVGFSY
jgi:hypothetical protein